MTYMICGVSCSLVSYEFVCKCCCCIIDALMKDDSKYNGSGSQPVTLSIRLGSAEDVRAVISYIISSNYTPLFYVHRDSLKNGSNSKQVKPSLKPDCQSTTCEHHADKKRVTTHLSPTCIL